MIDRKRARALAADAVASGKPTEWFETLYREAGGESEAIPWADLVANPYFVEWADSTGLRGEGKRALKIGCGLGDDAEDLARRGFETTAFDVSESAIRWCKQRFPSSRVHYAAADLMAPPAEWRGAFDFVLEAYTLQVLPESIRARAIVRVAQFVREGGTLVVICRGREPHDPEGELPWPLLHEEVMSFTNFGFHLIRFDDLEDDTETPRVRRFRAVFRR